MQRGQVVKLDRGYPLVRTDEGSFVRCEHATALVKGEEVRAVIGDFVDAAQGAHPFLPDGDILRDQFGHLHFGNERRRLGCRILFPFAGS